MASKDLQSLEERLKQRVPILKVFNFRLKKADAGEVVLEVKHDPILEREGGILFGGIIALLFDVVMGLAVFTVNDKRDQATVSLSVDFLRPAKSDTYIFKGRVVKKGKTAVFVEGTLSDGEEIFARAHGIWYLKE